MTSVLTGQVPVTFLLPQREEVVKMTQAPSSSATIEDRVRSEVERTIQRGIKGLEYIATGDPAVGATPKDVIYSR
ncbi:MAG: hypothetical protein ABI939_05925, partial [Anaerolineaceae bacterium]